MAAGKIGIIAGSGQFPFLVAEGAAANGLSVFAVGFEGNTDPDLAGRCQAFELMHLGQLGRLIDFFKKHGVDTVCMAGAISKPRALDLRPDMRAAKVIFRLAGSKGDDIILRAVTEELQSEGIRVTSPDDLAPSLRSPSGVLTKIKPTEDLWRDIRLGWNAAKTLGALDIGQCIVMCRGIVVAVEAIEGTDALLARGGELGGAGCTAVKVLKPGQDTRLDLPSVGLGTVDLLARHKYACLAFEAGGTLFFDRSRALAAADAAKLAVVGIPPDADAFFAAHAPK